jgi:hypothetical protein
MYCQSCGAALPRPMKYCNHCGAKLVAEKKGGGESPPEKRLDEYLDGLFWITVFGLGLILGGMALMKKVLHLGDGLIAAYLILSSLAFLINFGLSLWEISRMMRSPGKAENALGRGERETNKLGLAAPPAALGPAPSVTEDATQRLEATPRERSAG